MFYHIYRAGCRVDLDDSLGRSVLFIAIQNEQYHLAEAMMAAGATISQGIEIVISFFYIH